MQGPGGRNWHRVTVERVVQRSPSRVTYQADTIVHADTDADGEPSWPKPAGAVGADADMLEALPPPDGADFEMEIMTLAGMGAECKPNVRSEGGAGAVGADAEMQEATVIDLTDDTDEPPSAGDLQGVRGSAESRRCADPVDGPQVAGEVLARRLGRLRQQVTCYHGQTCTTTRKCPSWWRIQTTTRCRPTPTNEVISHLLSGIIPLGGESAMSRPRIVY